MQKKNDEYVFDVQSVNHACHGAAASTATSHGEVFGNDNMLNSRSTTTRNLDLTGCATEPAPGLCSIRDASAVAARDLATTAKSLSAIRDKLLDEALEGTFPASDPIASMNFTR
jgi:hypothetical protein